MTFAPTVAFALCVGAAVLGAATAYIRMRAKRDRGAWAALTATSSPHAAYGRGFGPVAKVAGGVALSALVINLGSGAATAAPAPTSLVRTFIRYCGSTHGEVASALALADADGWRELPTASAPPAQFQWPQKQGMKIRTTAASGTRWLGAGAPTDGKGMVIRICAVTQGLWADAADPQAMAEVRREFADWAGVPRQAAPDPERIFLFTFSDSPGGHRPLPPSVYPRKHGSPWPDHAVRVMLVFMGGATTLTYVSPP
jgi:hypothetical protein